MRMQCIVVGLVGALAAISHAAFVNADFEDASGTFPTGWNTSGTVNQGAGLDGTTTAAELEASATADQDFVDGGGGETGFEKFQLDYIIKVSDVTNNNRVRIRGDGNSTNLITLRLNASGLQKFSSGPGWFTMVAAGDLPGGAVLTDTEYYVRVTVDDLDAPTDTALEYQIGVSTDGVNYVNSVAAGSWHGSDTSADAPFETVRIEAGSGATVTYDEFSVIEIPEPASLVLLALGALAVARVRR